VRPEAFSPTGAALGDALVALTMPATREVLGSETLVQAHVGPVEVTVKLTGLVRDVPPRVAAPATALHLFSADTGARMEP